jgi:hypothetical protein
MKIALLITSMLFVVSCRKSQAVFQRSSSETSSEQPKKFSFKINPIKLKSKTIRLDSTSNYNRQNLSQKIDNQLFINNITPREVPIFKAMRNTPKENMVIQKTTNSGFSTIPFALTLGATMLFAMVVGINFLIAGSGLSTIWWVISGLLSFVGLKQKEISSQNSIQITRIMLIISYLALLLVLVTSLVLAID